MDWAAYFVIIVLAYGFGAALGYGLATWYSKDD